MCREPSVHPSRIWTLVSKEIMRLSGMRSSDVLPCFKLSYSVYLPDTAFQKALYGLNHYIDFFVRWLPYIPIHVKKDLMTMLRVGVQVGSSTRIRSKGIYKKISASTFSKPIYSTQQGTIPGQDVLEYARFFMESPIRRSILSMLLRCSSSSDEEEIKQIIHDSITKEYHAGCTIRPSVLSYPFFFRSYEASRFSMCPEIPYRPYCISAVHQILVTWRRHLSRRTLFPQSSYKHVGHHTEENFNQHVFGNLIPDLRRHKVSTNDLERLYCDEGVRIPGPCEMRYSWKYNDLKPRVYYATGGSAFFAARYVRIIFDSLMRSFKNSDPVHRTTFDRFPLVHFPDDSLIIYDYTSFTSQLVELRRFIEELAYFLRGTKVTIFDTNLGYIEKDLFDILSEYNDVCNTRVEYSVHRVLDLDPNNPCVIVPNYIAGLLGVYGNITSSTALHGIVGFMISGDMDSSNTIGDDGAIIYSKLEMDRDEVVEAIRTLGIIADEKFEEFDVDQNDVEESVSWHFVKRPLVVEDNVIKHGYLFDLPILPIILGDSDNMHTTIIPDFITRRRLLIKQTSRLFDKMHLHASQISETDVQLILEILKRAYRRLDLPFAGGFPNRYAKTIPGRNTRDRYLAIPALNLESITEGWFSHLSSRAVQDGSIISFPKLTTKRSILRLPEDPYIGEIFETRAIKEISILVKLGFLNQEVVSEDHLATPETLSLFKSFLCRELIPVYRFVVVEIYHHWSNIVETNDNDES